MSLISFTPVTDGSTAVAAGVNTPLSTIYNDYNGGITDANISASAAIAGSKVNFASGVVPYKFRVYRAGAFTTTNGSFTKLPFDTKSYDTGGNVDITTNIGRFTAPVAGYYQFNALSQIVVTGSGTVTTAVALYKNGAEISRGNEYSSTGGAGSVANSVADTIQLSATDFIEVYIFLNAALSLGVGSNTQYFSGFLVSA